MLQIRLPHLKSPQANLDDSRHTKAIFMSPQLDHLNMSVLPSQIIEKAIQFLSHLDQTASSSTNILSPLINYYDTCNHSGSDTSHIIPIIARVTWKYIFHSRLDISSVIYHCEWLKRFTIDVGDHMKFSDWAMAMNATSTGSDTDEHNDLVVSKSFLGLVGAYLGKFMSITNVQISGERVKEVEDGINKLLELAFQDRMSREFTRRFSGLYPYIGEYVSQRQDSVPCKVMHQIINELSMTIEEAFKIVLQTLDHGITTHLDFRLVDKLRVAIETIHQNDLEVILQAFNKLICKTSLVMTLNYLNYILSYKLSNRNPNLVLPVTITRQFECFVLPPISKLEVQDPKEEIEKVFEQMYESEIPENLSVIQFRTLQLLARFLPQEAPTIEHTSQVKIASLTSKIVEQFNGMVISSLISALLVDSNNKYKQEVVFSTFHTLLSVKYTTKSNKIWITLINAVNDICYADLRYIPNFITLFEYLMKKDATIVDDELISGGLTFFIDTFDPEYKWFSKRETPVQLNYEIKMEDYKFLYGDAPTTPVKQGRQQSIHVDQFK
ncbi:uncharacterized protein SPAPADRAFT_52750 [Spathaspora passalidarum NRRL Y-27907]|uniref:Uncharacterized protein n=1 Tax=Spathaspora passalidarum (strain NRRL Y-27907 / 11-Y1) TaxID=619300 RepID=G3AV94_SPAPN|nr:uncharacterized protein SPAPADRAFT_52750 [Spathaspora passalidarum NRRL Y-27907]EGW29897.1 hypothetical protein SPAPADRAFT_52750 [Spathaspora passalidarum NRRL Y-27907]